jgi:hypothetical protein
MDVLHADLGVGHLRDRHGRLVRGRRRVGISKSSPIPDGYGPAQRERMDSHIVLSSHSSVSQLKLWSSQVR